MTSLPLQSTPSCFWLQAGEPLKSFTMSNLIGYREESWWHFVGMNLSPHPPLRMSFGGKVQISSKCWLFLGLLQSFAHEKVHGTGTSLGTVDGLAMAILCRAVKWLLFYPVSFPLHHCLSLLLFYCGTFVAVSRCWMPQNKQWPWWEANL